MFFWTRGCVDKGIKAEGYIDKEFSKGTSLRTLTAKGYDDKEPKRPERNSAGPAHFSGPLTNPCIYDMSTMTFVRPSPHKYEV